MRALSGPRKGNNLYDAVLPREDQPMLKPIYYAVAAGVCGAIALIIANDTPDGVAAAGVAAGFSVSVGLFGLAAAISDRA